MTRGERVIKFIETYLVVPEGSLVGKPVKLAPFQRKFLLAVYDNPHVTDTAILSIARKNAKTALVAFIVLAHLVGPEAVQNSRIVSGAMSRDQAGEVYNLASKCAALSPKLRGLVHPIPSKKTLVGVPLNVEYSAISAEATTAHGKSPIVAILDEVGQIKGPKSDFVDAITTAQGAYENPLLIYMSTQAPTDADFFSILIDDALKKKPKKTVCHVYEAPKGCDFLDESAWAAANPALGLFRSESDMRKQAEKAKRMPSFANTFRNLNLNQRVSTFSPFIPGDLWKSAARPGLEIPEGAEVWGGLDLSMRTDLTAAAFIARVNGITYAKVYFWTPEDGLADREHKDRAPYPQWVSEGHLQATPGATVDYDFVVADIMRICEGWHLRQLAFDPWRIDLFRKACQTAGVDLPMVEHSQGFKDMSPALQELESQLLNGSLHHDANPVLTMCAANASTSANANSERILNKNKSTGRIDGIVALAMAVGAWARSAPGDVPHEFHEPIILDW